MLISSVVPTERTPREHRENTDTSTSSSSHENDTFNQIVDANKKVLEQIQELATAQKEAYAAALQEKDDKIQELKYYLELQKDYVDGQKRTIERLEQFIEHLQEENRELKKSTLICYRNSCQKRIRQIIYPFITKHSTLN